MQLESNTLFGTDSPLHLFKLFASFDHLPLRKSCFGKWHQHFCENVAHQPGLLASKSRLACESGSNLEFICMWVTEKWWSSQGCHNTNLSKTGFRKNRNNKDTNPFMNKWGKTLFNSSQLWVFQLLLVISGFCAWTLGQFNGRKKEQKHVEEARCLGNLKGFSLNV